MDRGTPVPVATQRTARTGVTRPYPPFSLQKSSVTSVVLKDFCFFLKRSGFFSFVRERTQKGEIDELHD
jgi:hypothetical protein